jgi:hypothetical protein
MNIMEYLLELNKWHNVSKIFDCECTFSQIDDYMHYRYEDLTTNVSFPIVNFILEPFCNQPMGTLEYKKLPNTQSFFIHSSKLTYICLFTCKFLKQLQCHYL